ncbi:COMM domain-containing protein 1-like [Amphiura filiformis]|uniref:COMM domain-containing protein 1-like n=1 Tax=Amphiura filiformis TaxID=82378 RepID=UPI003B227C71
MADEEEIRRVVGLLNGLAKREYYGNKDISDDFLKTELYPDDSEEDFSVRLTKCKNLLKSIASADMDFNQLEAFLTSHTRKKEGGITKNQATAFSKFWKSNKVKIHESMVAKNTWGNTLKSLSWRIDIKSQAKHIDQLNTPTAIVELQIAESQASDKEADVVRFEMDEEKLVQVTQSLNEIEERLAAYTK